MYCVRVWGGASASYLNSIFLLQTRIIRLIISQSYLEHTNPLFYRTGILKLDDVYKLNVGVFMYGQVLSNSVATLDHPYNTRHRIDPLPSFHRLTQSQRSLSFQGPLIWNQIPLQIRNSSSLKVFKRDFKKYMLETYIT